MGTAQVSIGVRIVSWVRAKDGAGAVAPSLELGPTLDPIPTPIPTDDSPSSDLATDTTFPMGKAKRALSESNDKADGCLRSSDASQIQRLMHSHDLSVDEIEWVLEYDSYRGKSVLAKRSLKEKVEL